MTIKFYNEDIDKFRFNISVARINVAELIKLEGKKAGELAVIFCSDKYLLQLNKEHLGHNYYTDIITYNYCDGDIISGDIFISLDRIKDNSLQYSTSFKDELYRVIFHGVLHLVGYDDKMDDDKVMMRGKEDYYLDTLIRKQNATRI